MSIAAMIVPEGLIRISQSRKTDIETCPVEIQGTARDLPEEEKAIPLRSSGDHHGALRDRRDLHIEQIRILDHDPGSAGRDPESPRQLPDGGLDGDRGQAANVQRNPLQPYHDEKAVRQPLSQGRARGRR